MYRYDEEERYTPPAKLDENRSYWKLAILNPLTLGIYGIIFYIPFSFDLDKIATRNDGKKTMNYLLAHILALVTFAIVIEAWHYMVTERVEAELTRREIDYDFGTNDFWGWCVLGSLILVGPFIYQYKLIKAMNLLCKSYNKEMAAIGSK